VAELPAVSSPSAADLLLAWEWGSQVPAAERGVVLLATVLADRPVESLAAMSVGERDLHLLSARGMLFGPELDCVVSCPECSTALELRVAVDDLLAGAMPGSEPTEESGEIAAAGWTLRFRRLTLQDLLDATAAADPAEARETLLRRSVEATVQPDGSETQGVPAGGLPAEVELTLVEEMERREPMAPLDFELECPDCGRAWTAPFDIAAFLWAEIDGWAQRTLREVHALASAYGWRESDILALSPWRREAYLQMGGDA
jgi:hypothetical protein